MPKVRFTKSISVFKFTLLLSTVFVRNTLMVKLHATFGEQREAKLKKH